MIFFWLSPTPEKKLAIDSSKREDKPIFIEKMNLKNELSQNNHGFLKFLEKSEKWFKDLFG